MRRAIDGPSATGTRPTLADIETRTGKFVAPPVTADAARTEARTSRRRKT